MMDAEVLAIGDELTSGQRVDTNSAWLSERLGQIGVSTRFHTTVGDQMADLVLALRTTIDRVPLVVITGGLGPTADDLTREAMALAADRKLVLRADALAQIESIFAQRGRPMPERNRVQAMFPAGSHVIPNPHGTAPGVDLTVRSGDNVCRWFALPGVPAEMQEMWEATVEPAIRASLGIRQTICHRRIKCFGVGESQLEAMLPDLIHRSRIPSVGITVHRATITLRITALGPDRATCMTLMQPTVDTIYACLGRLIFGEEDDELEHAVCRLLDRTDRSLAICEWGTAGLLTRWLQAVDDRSAPRIRAALSSCHASTLRAWLGGEETHGASCDSCDESLLRWMASSARLRSDADYGLAVGPLPDPQSSSPQLLMAVATRDGCQVVANSYAGHPDIVLDRAAKQALDRLRQILLDEVEMTP
jgi:nicotinamide-nucleotide amidase